jgi:hypothetical protein
MLFWCWWFWRAQIQLLKIECHSFWICLMLPHVWRNNVHLSLIAEDNFNYLVKLLCDCSAVWVIIWILYYIAHLPLAINKWSLERHFKTMQLTCFPPKFPHGLSIHWWAVSKPIFIMSCKMVASQGRHTLHICTVSKSLPFPFIYFILISLSAYQYELINSWGGG